MSDNKIQCKYNRIQDSNTGLVMVKPANCKPCQHGVRTIAGNPLQYAVALMGKGNQINDVVVPSYANDQKTILEYASVMHNTKSYLTAKVEWMIRASKARKVVLCPGHWDAVRKGHFDARIDSLIPGHDYTSESVSARCSSGSHI